MKNVIITGASGGIGLSIAEILAKDYNLILIYNKNSEPVEIFLKENKGKHIGLKCDLTKISEVESLFDTLKEKNIEIYGLVNSAGVSKSNLIQNVDEDEFNYIMDSNFKSCFNATKYAVKDMISNKDGRIINISSMWGSVGASMESIYSASKGAMNSFTLSLAKELGPSNITVNAICPGLIDTKMNSCYSKAELQDIIDSTPLNRIGKPEDVANLTKFLLSDQSSFITGQIITIDGGLTL